jgi:DNA-binding MarR family transcriptional regulator
MLLGELLVAQGIVSTSEIEQAIQKQKETGVRLGDCLVSMGLISREELDATLLKTPSAPSSVEDTGLSRDLLLDLMMKSLNVGAAESEVDLAAHLCLPVPVLKELVEDAGRRELVERKGNPSDVFGVNYVLRLTDRGKSWANEAQERNLYAGPAPVPFQRYCEQIQVQSILAENLTMEDFESTFSGLVFPDWFIRVIGPATNAAHTVLFYGKSGNGKTTMALRIAEMFKDIIFIPHCVEVDGQIIRIFDSLLHNDIRSQEATDVASAALVQQRFDSRWLPCTRPLVVAGGELTMEMLDLSYDNISKFYEAPLHMKALNGTFIVDDFGRQHVSPTDLLNRWIVPMESRKEYLRLHTGNTVEVPFDELLFFTTNLAPKDLMDPAFLRRIPYKIELQSPAREEYVALCHAVFTGADMPVQDDDIDHLIDRVENYYDEPLAYYHPGFIARQIRESCSFQGLPVAYNRKLAEDALANLFIRPEDK